MMILPEPVRKALACRRLRHRGLVAVGLNVAADAVDSQSEADSKRIDAPVVIFN